MERRHPHNTLFRRHPALTGIAFALLLVLALFGGLSLLEHDAVDTRDTLGRTPLIVAADRGDLDTVHRLLHRGAVVDATDNCGWTALMKAAMRGHGAVVVRLLAAGAAIDHRDKAGYSALMVAVVNRRAGTAAMLLDRGAAVDLVDTTKGWSAMSWAAKDGQIELVDILLAHGAELNRPDRDGNTPLALATRNGHRVVIERLRTAGDLVH